mmetsp:Transcript_7176/g.20339  ORF Transcript_7176/g.20339 Transcript_7176/m.20339 type:complete len:268 (+) Transcript_7176:91-894(+)
MRIILRGWGVAQVGVGGVGRRRRNVNSNGLESGGHGLRHPNATTVDDRPIDVRVLELGDVGAAGRGGVARGPEHSQPVLVPGKGVAVPRVRGNEELVAIFAHERLRGVTLGEQHPHLVANAGRPPLLACFPHHVVPHPPAVLDGGREPGEVDVRHKRHVHVTKDVVHHTAQTLRLHHLIHSPHSQPDAHQVHVRPPMFQVGPAAGVHKEGLEGEEQTLHVRLHVQNAFAPVSYSDIPLRMLPRRRRCLLVGGKVKHSVFSHPVQPGP